jgi:hypothetical protein
MFEERKYAESLTPLLQLVIVDKKCVSNVELYLILEYPAVMWVMQNLGSILSKMV